MSSNLNHQKKYRFFAISVWSAFADNQSQLRDSGVAGLLAVVHAVFLGVIVDSGTALSPNGMHKPEAASIVILHYRRTICTNPMHRQCLLSILDFGTDSQGEWVWPVCPLTKRECELHSPFLSLLCFSARKPSGPIKITHYGQLSANSCMLFCITLH